MKSYVKMTLAILIAYVLTFCTFSAIQLNSDYEKTEINDAVTTFIHRSGGKVEVHKGNRFPILNKGDMLTARFPIPADISYRSPAICFGIDNCHITLSYGKQVLHTYGQDLAKAGKYIGSVYASVPVPEEAIGSELVLRAVSTENHSTGEISHVSILPGLEARHWLIMDNLPQSIFLMTILTASFLMSIVLILCDGRRKFVRMSLWLVSFLSLVATYRLASRGILYSFIGDNWLCSNIECICFFAMPIALFAFCSEFYTGRKTHAFALAVLTIQCAFFTAVTILNYTTSNYHYNYYLKFQHLIIFMAILAAFLVSRKITLYEEDSDSTKCMCSGLYNFFVCVIIDTIRYYIQKYTPKYIPILEIDILFLGILLVTASFILSIFLRMLHVNAEKQKRAYFEHLAYTDVLTGLNNRTKYYETITLMRLNHINAYTIIFMDLNNLKEVNDCFGHEYGDLYIKSAANAITSTFGEGFRNFRLGGDEFLAIYCGVLEQDLSKVISDFKNIFGEICTRQELPFRGSIACGTASSIPESPLDIEEAVKQADSKMYEDKEHIKKLYGAHCRIITPDSDQIPTVKVPAADL